MDAQLYLKRHSEELSRKYPGKYVAIVDENVVAVDHSPLIAFNKAKSIAGDREIAVFYMATDEETVALPFQ